jgi:hypothetical protein
LRVTVEKEQSAHRPSTTRSSDPNVRSPDTFFEHL